MIVNNKTSYSIWKTAGSQDTITVCIIMSNFIVHIQGLIMTGGSVEQNQSNKT